MCVLYVYVLPCEQANLSKGVPSLGSDLSALITVVVPAGAAAAADDNSSSSSDAAAAAAAAATTRVIMATDPVDLLEHPVLTAVSELCDTYIAALRCVTFTTLYTNNFSCVTFEQAACMLSYSGIARSHQSLN
jgi:hypothetical protein